MKETDLIKKYFSPLSKNFKPSISLQDDGAILKNFDKENFIISVDCFIEGVHCPNGLEPKLMIIRAIYCATSDLAAMASIPYCMFLSLTIPKNKEESFFIVGKSNFMRWLNDFADNEKYTFFSTQEKLQAYLSAVYAKVIRNPALLNQNLEFFGARFLLSFMVFLHQKQ